ncbi:hypothetical protein DB88DRAFT_548834 [Papiliotrema laurentii]|uniref:Uncharacterized protein n=1 Tax=Papiliotrema laurentii TaxID=5418 RepID=A0AAD9CUB7_PAPLA|nr:hypothetical protein DB88DRAFT_548871 [Papiliotrema laurentii]KAK1920708.1 hypothetical protein DB88DRAFT_548834 [Papiliotrema laurentii]
MDSRAALLYCNLLNDYADTRMQKQTLKILYRGTGILSFEGYREVVSIGCFTLHQMCSPMNAKTACLFSPGSPSQAIPARPAPVFHSPPRCDSTAGSHNPAKMHAWTAHLVSSAE